MTRLQPASHAEKGAKPAPSPSSISILFRARYPCPDADTDFCIAEIPRREPRAPLTPARSVSRRKCRPLLHPRGHPNLCYACVAPPVGGRRGARSVGLDPGPRRRSRTRAVRFNYDSDGVLVGPTTPAVATSAARSGSAVPGARPSRTTFGERAPLFAKSYRSPVRSV